MEDTVRRRVGSSGELPLPTETIQTTLRGGKYVSGEAVRQRTPPGRAWRSRWFDEVGRGVVARTSRKPLRGTRKGAYFSSSERKVELLVQAELLDHSGVVGKRDDSVNTLSRISPGLVRWKPLGEDPLVKVFVFLMPSARLLRRALVARACFALVRQKAERPCDRGAVARQTENDWRLLGAV